MRFNITGQNIDLSDRLKEQVSNKLSKKESMFPDDTVVNVRLRNQKNDYIAEVTIPLKNRTLRAESRSDDIFTAIDDVSDSIERQMRKYKTRLKNRSRVDKQFLAEFESIEDLLADSQEEEVFKIEKIKRFELKPMDAEEAIMEMELLDHNFFVFRNRDTDEVNVVYKRYSRGYGLIEPEL